MMARPPEPIVREAEVDGLFRWTLTRRWDDRPLMACLGCNPSYADARRDDPTMWVVMKFAFAWGYGGVDMLNVHPFISPDIAKLRTWFQTPGLARMEVLAAMLRNAEMAAAAFERCKVSVAAWGNLVEPHVADNFVKRIAELRREPLNLHCFGLTSSGAPKHPMARGRHRIPDDATLQFWKRVAA